MQSKSIFRRIIMSLLGLITSISIAMAPMGNMGMPSMDDIQAMEAEIDKFVRSLPPEQQKQFYKDVEELTNIMEKMTPDELNDFVGNVFTEAGLIEQPVPAKPAPKPEVTKAKEEAKPVIAVTTAPSAPTEKAVSMINAIIKRTEEFMRKAQVIPELQAKMNKWVVQKKLLDVTANLDWQTVETQIDELNVLLYHLKETDPVTGQYKHIGNLIKDEALYNNLATLQVTLDAYVPAVQIPPFGLETVSKESRAAIREVLSQYLEAFYLLNVPAAIKKVKALYEPRAKQLKEEEKQRAEKAYGEAQKTRTPAPAVKSPGTKAPSTPPTYSPPAPSRSADHTPSYTPSAAAPSAKSEARTPDIWEQNKTYQGRALLNPKAAPKETKGGEKGKKPDTGKGKEETFGEETQEAPSTDGGTGGKGGTGGTSGTPTQKDRNLDYKASRLAGKVDSGLEKLKAFEKEFKNIAAQFTSSSDFKENDPKLKDRVAAMETAQSSLKSAISDMKKLKDDIKALSPEKQEDYKTLLPDYLSDAVKFYKSIRNSINTEGATIRSYKATYQASHPIKYYIYFGEGTPPDPVKTAVPNVPVTLDVLGKAIDDFLNEAK